LPGRGVAVACKPPRQPAGGVAADLPKEWAADEERRRKAGVPEEVDFATKPQIALSSFVRRVRRACGAALC
jgi:DDE superfamily endonuclease